MAFLNQSGAVGQQGRVFFRIIVERYDDRDVEPGPGAGKGLAQPVVSDARSDSPAGRRAKLAAL